MLAAHGAAGAQSFSQLSEAGGGMDVPAAAAPEQVIAQEDAAAQEGSQAAVDFLVRPEAEHETGAELFDPAQLSYTSAAAGKAAGGGPAIPYLELAKAEAKAQGVDLALVLAVIQKESSFDPNARSAVGARGLMQLMPSTAKWLGLKDATQLSKPAVNIKYGVKYLKYLWDEFSTIPSGDLSAADMKQKTAQMAIAAYNAGQGNVRKYDGVPPFKETRNYVKKVTEYFAQYEELLAGLLP